MKTTNNDELEKYRAKRDAARSPEPMGGTRVRGRRFVVQHHLARREHHDLRLEHNGVLLCWAVPKGPSADPADKRLAVQTEPHPLRYTNFEGVIPEGNYGAGSMIVWDQGNYTPLIDMDEGLERGKLLVTFHGHKLHGTWTLVRTKQNWLFIKERDGYVRSGRENRFPRDSILSGLTVRGRRVPERAARRLGRHLEAAGAPQVAKGFRPPPPMLATAHEPFSHPDWVFELKYDGYRALAVRSGPKVVLRSRNGNDLSEYFPDLVYPLEQLPYEPFMIDGEIVCLDGEGRSSFSRLQARARLRNAHEREAATLTAPASFFAFDLVAALGHDCRSLPLLERKRLLELLLPSTGPVRYGDHLEARGETLYAYAAENGLEGMVAKRAASTYQSGRSPDWRKCALTSTEDFVVAGWAPSASAGHELRGLLLARYIQGTLVYQGRAGTGMSAADRDALCATLSALPAAKPPAEAPPDADSRWVEPRLVAEVRFKQRTADGLLRAPVFVRLRDDKSPLECGDGIAVAEPEPERPALSNPDKVLWPDDGITKAGLAHYYEGMAEWLLPYLADRPVTLKRYPDGIHGEHFFQKNAPAGVPGWVRVEAVTSESGSVTDYLVIETPSALAYVANLAAIELHITAYTLRDPDHPTWFVIDLDPKDAPFEWVVAAAKETVRICASIELPSFVKTSGSTGLHVLVPGGGVLDAEQGTMLTVLVARLVNAVLPGQTTLERRIERRGGKVYLDCGQNRRGATIAVPFGVRARPRAPVSMPIRPGELGARLANGNFRIDNAARRMARLGADPLLPILSAPVDFKRALALLEAQLE
ncbi:MAG TPA: DNA ligase D [Woeseiaceae bacterium]|nr:DNA ligase D [Woeseiaceae bacterium]